MDAAIITNGRTCYFRVIGFRRAKSSDAARNIYMKRKRKPQCRAGASALTTGQTFRIIEGRDATSYLHAPDLEELEAVQIVLSSKVEATDHPDDRPSRILRILEEVSPAG